MRHPTTGDKPLSITAVNAYLAMKQHLVPGTEDTDVIGVTRDIVALHATAPTGPFLSLWARVRRRGGTEFDRGMLEYALYDSRELARIPCMRNTVHIVPSDQVGRFVGAYSTRYLPPEFRNWGELFVRARLCREEDADRLLAQLVQQVPAIVREDGPLTVGEITRRVPELAARVQHSVGKAYEGDFSLGSRFVPFLCAAGLLVRARPRGTWRSNLYEYAAMARWLPGLDGAAVLPEEAQSWLVERYLRAFGPATLADVQWWTGFSAAEAQQALASLGSQIVPVAIDGLGGDFLMVGEDAQHLRVFTVLGERSGCFLPALDPYIMGYQDRRRFLAAEHQGKVFDRAGNALPTVWVDGRVVGAWTQRKDGSVAYALFEGVGGEASAMLDEKRARLELFFGGEYVPQRTHSPFTRSLGQ